MFKPTFGSKPLLVPLLVFLFALGLVAVAQEQCNPAMNELLENGRPAWTEGVEELTWYNAGDTQFDPAIVEGALAFEKQYGIEVNLEGIPETNFVTQAARFLATGDSTYDVFDMYMAFPMPTWAARGWLAPVDCAVPQYLIEQWPAGYWEAAEYEGQHYFVPHIVQPYIFLWNKQAFREAGLDPNSPPDSWEELVEYAEKLTVDENGDGNIDQWGFVFPAGRIQRVPILSYAYFLGMAGQPLWNEDGSPAFDSEIGVQTMQFMSDLIHKYEVTPQGVVNYNTSNVADVLRSGGAAMGMLFVGHPTHAVVDALGLENVGASAPPARTEETNAIYPFGFVGPAMYVNANSQHVVAAKHLAAFMGSYVQSWRETAVEGNVGANLGIWDSPYVQAQFPFGDVARQIQGQGYVPTHGGLLKALLIFQEGLHAALTGQINAQQAIDQIVSDLKAQDVVE